jgi:hypothetical protein
MTDDTDAKAKELQHQLAADKTEVARLREELSRALEQSSAAAKRADSITLARTPGKLDSNVQASEALDAARAEVEALGRKLTQARGAYIKTLRVAVAGKLHTNENSGELQVKAIVDAALNAVAHKIDINDDDAVIEALENTLMN